jgi:hypothetical protein
MNAIGIAPSKEADDDGIIALKMEEGKYEIPVRSECVGELLSCDLSRGHHAACDPVGPDIGRLVH